MRAQRLSVLLPVLLAACQGPPAPTIEAAQAQPRLNDPLLFLVTQDHPRVIDLVMSVGPDCTFARSGEVEVADSPAHGTVSKELVKDATRRPDQSPGCAIREADAVRMVYTPAPGYTGPDSVALHENVNGAIADKRLDLIVAAGARPAAEPASTSRYLPVVHYDVLPDQPVMLATRCEAQASTVVTVSYPAGHGRAWLGEAPGGCAPGTAKSVGIYYQPSTTYAGPDLFTIGELNGTVETLIPYDLTVR